MPSPTLTGFEQRVIVGIADLAVSNNPDVTLATYSLGSCLGISVYDPVVRVGGLLHIMLPDSGIDTCKAKAQPAMFLDTGLPTLFRAAYQLRAEKYRMLVCVAGGAQVMDSSGFFNIGKRNYEAFRAVCQAHGLRIQAEQVGGLTSRSMFLKLSTGEVRLKVSGQTSEMVLCKNLTNT
jgi:chemotaxis protein CheD